MTNDISSLKQSVCDAIDAAQSELFAIGDDIFLHPELGFREKRTASVVADYLRGLGLEPRTGLAVTGVKAVIKGAKPGPNLAVIAELDSVVCSKHPRAERDTGAAHACGHNSELAALLGAAAGLVRSGAARELCGSVTIFAVPAEECIDFDYRFRLMRDGVIAIPSGKPELVRLGEFDDIDLAMMTHASPNRPGCVFNVGNTSLGFVTKDITFLGKASHAGAAPFDGINALNAAMLAIMGFHVNRETFRDSDKVRVHPIMLNGGEVINTVPDFARLQLMVRAATIPAMQDACKKVDRSVEGACTTVGARCKIDDLPGYLPMMESAELNAVFEREASELFGSGAVTHDELSFGSTDMGDISQLLPSIHVMHGGFSGGLHRPDFCIADKEAAYIAPAKAFAVTAISLLADGAREAERVIKSFTPGLSKQEYLGLVTPKTAE